jgi:formate hydrogenlyase transcriptional activator
MSETGSEFFHALARNLSEALQTCGAWITEYLPETRRLRALAFWLNGGFLEHYEHAIDGTPCQAVIETKSRAHFPERLLEFFPTEPDLAALGAASCMGIPLLDADGTCSGIWPCWTIARCLPSRIFTSCSISSRCGLSQSSGGCERKP